MCLVQTGRGGTREKENVARPTGISRRDSLPPLNAAAVVQVEQSVRRVRDVRARMLLDALHLAAGGRARVLFIPPQGKHAALSVDEADKGLYKNGFGACMEGL